MHTGTGWKKRMNEFSIILEIKKKRQSPPKKQQHQTNNNNNKKPNKNPTTKPQEINTTRAKINNSITMSTKR